MTDQEEFGNQTLILGIIIGDALILLVIIGIATGYRVWAVILLTILLSIWWLKGWRKVEIGWYGVLTLFSRRIKEYVFDEGTPWLPWPFNIKPVDCRNTSLELNSLEIITSD